MYDMMKLVGCYPPYAHPHGPHTSKFPKCSTRDQLRSFRILFHEALTMSDHFAKTTPLCNTIQKIGIDIEDTDYHIGKPQNGSETDPNLDVEGIMQAYEQNGNSDDF